MSLETADNNLLNNPKFKAFIDAFTQVSQDSANLSLDESRKLGTQFFLPAETIYEPVKRIENIEIEGRENKIRLRLYIPDDSKNLPVIVYFHRGGWVFGNLEECDPVCRKLANHLECILVSVDYSLAPENPFPKPLRDAYYATEWVSNNISDFGGDSDEIIVCGESAGGNLAASVALMARDLHGPFIAAQVLIYPVITSTIDATPYEKCVDRYFITQEAMTFFWSMYLQSNEERDDGYASPEKSKDLSKLPPALIITADYDALKFEAEAYGKQLIEAGNQVITHNFPAVIHGFLDLPIYEEKEKIAWIKEIGKLLNSLRAVYDN